tara:strand:+ start:97 stop:270 length:174 start_codon:yes stop_codon:yes gene_type:complete
MRFQIGYMAFLSIVLLLMGTWGAHKKDSVTDFSQKEESTEYYQQTDYSTIDWEATRP